MRIKPGPKSLGFVFEISGGDYQSRKPSPTASQEKPRGYYVYGHYDLEGNLFYVGKGTGRRAWNESKRHYYWHLHVEENLKGKYKVVILEDNLSSDEAEDIEDDWMYQEGDNLLNWSNMHRGSDYDALNRFHALRDANRNLIAEGRSKEKENLEEAIAIYYKAIEHYDAYAIIQYEPGLLGKLKKIQQEKYGLTGEIRAIDRLSLCLIRAGRIEEAITAAENYFEKYKAAKHAKSSEPIIKRIGKAKEKLKKG